MTIDAGVQNLEANGAEGHHKGRSSKKSNPKRRFYIEDRIRIASESQ